MNNQQTLKLELLKNLSLFSTLKEQELTVVAQNSDFYSFRKGDVIFQEGNYGDGLYIIKEGGVLITKQRADNETMNLAQFIQGESFGELDLLENRVMTASAHAELETTLLIFPKRGTRFKEVLSQYPEMSARILHELLRIIAGRIRNTNRLVSEKSQWIQDLKEQLYFDKLTCLYNRTYLDEEFPGKLADYGTETTIIMVKPDNFKVINDTCGHEAGDKALRLIAFSMRSQLRKQDIVLRYRGDEFAVIFPGMDMQKAKLYAEQLRILISILNFDHIIGNPGFSVTVSIGVAAYPFHTRDPKELVTMCFNKMYQARDAGGNQIKTA